MQREKSKSTGYNMADDAVGGRVLCQYNEHQQVNDAFTACNGTRNDSKKIYNSEISRDMNITVKHEELDPQLPFEHDDDDLTVVKSEPADADCVYSSEVDGSVGPADVDGALDADTTMKQEMDIGPTELQPPDIQYMLRPCKTEQGEDTLQGCHETEGKSSSDKQLHMDTNQASTNKPHLKSQSTRKVLQNKLSRSVNSIKGTGNLKAHILTHTGERPHKCNICFKSFQTKQSLKRHMLIHSGERPHKCDDCFKSFQKKQSLKRHMLIHSGERPHKCDDCFKRFNRTDSLKQHKLTHTGVGPHKCDVCLKSFQRKIALRNHMLSHSCERPHKCKVCFKSFKRTAYLKNRMLTHTVERPH